MNRNLIMLIGGVLVVVAILGLLIPVIGPWIGLGSAPKPKQRNVTTDFEPQFTEEGFGAFVTENGDTLAAFRLELAESTAETTQGMMFRRSVPESTGMLFIMPEERFQSFWMRNTYVPLDIIYLSSEGRVVSIQANAQPLNETPLPSDGPAKYVLEIAGGQSAALGIKPGIQWLWNRNN